MRRLLALSVLAASAFSAIALVPAPDAEMPMVCIRHRDTDVPFTDRKIELPGDRFCVDIDIPGGDA